MACKTSYELHHNFPKIADEAGFTFNTHRPRIRIDWNKIRLIDTDSLIRERKFTIIEQHVNNILDCILESEFDVRILDEGVLKMFRLAQLAVEYQQFCRHYLDRSVYVLREEINTLAQELEVTKRDLKERDEEIKKLKRKTKHNYRTPLPYGNDNIASMILKTLANKSDFFPTTKTGDAIQYNKCSYCDKVFMNQLYLKSHVSRRHPHAMEIPQKDSEENLQNISNNTENTKLRDELFELKLKLREMEDVLKNVQRQDIAIGNHVNSIETKRTDQQSIATVAKQMIDAEVSTNHDINVLDKIEEWKKEEQEKYNKEINMLKNQILESIQTLKEKEMATNNANIENELKIIEQLNTTINQQGSEILALKQELINSKLTLEKDEAARRKENETQMMHWVNRAETHAKQYESLLLKLNDVEKEAKESRAQAEAEKGRVAQLEALLQRTLNDKLKADSVSDRQSILDHKSKDNENSPSLNSKPHTPGLREPNRQTLEQLHQKAQALLNIGSSSSSSSDVSSLIHKTPQLKINLNNKQSIKKHSQKKLENKEENSITSLKPKELTIQANHKNGNQDHHKIKDRKNKKLKSKPYTNHNSVKSEKNGPINSSLIPGSPMKIIRAKVMEEVNNRLVSAGVDPLNKRVTKLNYQKQRTQLQQQFELKVKRNPSHEIAKHSILTYLDSKLPRKAALPSQEYVSPNKVSKMFNLTSVISNVKSKALSLVKPNDINIKDKRKALNADITKKAMSLLNTPPDSMHSSPAIEKQGENVPQSNKAVPKRNALTSKTSLLQTARSNHSLRNSDSGTQSEIESDNSSQSSEKHYKTIVQQTKSIDKLIKSPARRPLSANLEYSNTVRNYVNSDEHLLRSQSTTNISIINSETKIESEELNRDNGSHSNSESSDNIPIDESLPKDNIVIKKQTKGVLKNASSTSSLNKKKVLFDMDAIQMKSLSASPSQSITEKSDGIEKYELGLINLDGEEWDISSIENEPLHHDTKLRISTRTTPKIAELKQAIESQLARRNDTPSTAIVGGVDILQGPMLRASSVGGSNTSLGSSILDESENLPPIVNQKAFIKPKTVAHKDDSEIDLSEFSTDGLTINKNDKDTF